MPPLSRGFIAELLPYAYVVNLRVAHSPRVRQKSARRRMRRFFLVTTALVLVGIARCFFFSPSPSDGPVTTLLLQSEEPVLVVYVVHGLCNRLRVYANAAAIARKSGRKLGVIWEPSVHSRTVFSDVFESEHLLVQKNTLPAELYALPNIKFYDYVDKSTRGQIIDLNAKRHVVIRSSTYLTSSVDVSEDDIDQELKLLKPTREVLKHAVRLRSRIGKRKYVGFHIRMLEDQAKDIPGAQALNLHSVDGMSLMYEAEAHRRKCDVRHFLSHMNRIVLENPGTLLYVASDTKEAIDTAKTKFGRQVISLDMHLVHKCQGKHRRGKFCAQLALAEVIILSQASYLFTSDWSSVSEIAVRLSNVQHSNGCATFDSS